MTSTSLPAVGPDVPKIRLVASGIGPVSSRQRFASSSARSARSSAGASSTITCPTWEAAVSAAVAVPGPSSPIGWSPTAA